MKKLGRYRLNELLGQGGMGDVYAATVEGAPVAGLPPSSRVCVKVMNKALSGNERAVELFLREARLAARLTHPNIVQIVELGRDQGTYFIAMEMLDGLPWHDIAQRCWRHGKVLPLEVIVVAAAQAAEALQYAHTLVDKDGKPSGMVHRDVSPDNLFLTTDGITRVLDFGIAKAVSHDATRLTEKGELRGKLPYMPPEQVKTEDVDGAADVWALGITLFYLSTAQRPFDRETPLAIMNAVLKEPAIPASSMNPVLPKAFSEVIARCLQKAPQDRWPTALAARDALLGLLPVSPDALTGRARELLAMASSLEKGERRPMTAQPSAPTMSWEKKKSLEKDLEKPTTPPKVAPRSVSGMAPPSPGAPRPEDRLPSRQPVRATAAPTEARPAERTTVTAPLLTADESEANFDDEGTRDISDVDDSEEDDSEEDDSEEDDSEEDGFDDEARTVAELVSLEIRRPGHELDPPTEALETELPDPGPTESTVAMAMDLSSLRDPPPPGDPSAIHGEFTALRTERLSEDETQGATNLLLSSADQTVASSSLVSQTPVSPPSSLAPAENPKTALSAFQSALKPLPVWVFGVAAFGVTVVVAVIAAAIIHVLR